MGIRRFFAGLLATAILLACAVGPALGQQASSDTARTLIYFVRHGEVDNNDPMHALNARGRERARAFAATVQDVMFTHVFSSHTTRTRQMVEPVAVARGLKATQLPQPGTRLDGRIVNEDTPTGAAVGPLTDALRRLPPGSRALVGVNRENVFAVMNGLGLPLASRSQPCLNGGNCVPCLNASCFPGGPQGDYDHLWILVIDSSSSTPQLIDLHYGVGPDDQRRTR